jgi:hypothetical protein
VREGVPLPEGLEEASGVAVSRRHAGISWHHADGGDRPLIHAVDEAGRLVGRVRVEGARLRDWEDLEVADCGGDSCLFVADVGDNSARRETVQVYRFLEPDPRTDTSVVAETLSLRFPEGPRDAEALFVLPGGRIHLVTKGRDHPVAVFRVPAGSSDARVVVLEEVQRLSDGPRAIPRQVTGASASADGSLVALRTYETLGFFRMDGDTLAAIPDGTVNLRPLREAQGEGVALGPEGLVVLTSEAGPMGERGGMVTMRCAAVE